MDSVFSFVVGLLTAALSLLGFVQQHPELPQSSRDQANQIAQQAITQATNALNTNSINSTQNEHFSGGILAAPTATSDSWQFTVGGKSYSLTEITYEIDFGDGSQEYLRCHAKSADDLTCTQFDAVTHTYRSSGHYTVKALGTGWRDNVKREVGQATIYAEVKATTSVIENKSFSAMPTSGAAPLLVSFSGGANGTTIDFGDGTTGSFTFPMCSPGSKCDAVASHRYTSAGTYVATLGSTGAKITVKVNEPVNSYAQLTPYPQYGQNPNLQAPLEVRFEAKTVEARSYTIDFGDGTPTVTLSAGCLPYHVCTVNHTYMSSGMYSASLKLDGTTVTTATINVAK